MKITEKEEAIRLRIQGFSMRDIAKKLNVSKASISKWTRDIYLDETQIKNLKNQQYAFHVVQKRRLVRLQNEDTKRNIAINTAVKEMRLISKKDLFIVGVALYWAEGGKTIRGMVRFSNSDKTMILLMMRFFREVCDVPEDKFRLHIHTHPGLPVESIEEYWSKITKIGRSKFYKTYVKYSISSEKIRKTLPNGTCDIYVCDTKLFLKITGWIKGMSGSLAVQ